MSKSQVSDSLTVPPQNVLDLQAAQNAILRDLHESGGLLPADSAPQDYQQVLDAVPRLRESLQDKFCELGQLLTQIKVKRYFKIKGYDTFKEYVADELGLPYALACKLVKVHTLFSAHLETSQMRQLGLDKLATILPAVQAQGADSIDKWVESAENCVDVADLRDEVAQARQKAAKPKEKSLSQLVAQSFVAEFAEKTGTQASAFEFNMAMYFHQEAEEKGRNNVFAHVNTQLGKARQTFNDHPEAFAPETANG